MKNAIIVVVAALSLIACQQKEAATGAASQSSGSASTTDPHAGNDPSAVGAVEAMSNAGSIESADIRYDLPDGWMRQAPSSSMRLDQASIPGAGGEGQLAVYFFGVGGGGGVDANLERWAAQVEHEGEPVRETFDVNGYQVTTIEVAGTLLPSGMSSGPSTPQPDSILYAAVVEGTGGPWFFKATGPKATMAPQKDAFVGMLKSVRASL